MAGLLVLKKSSTGGGLTGVCETGGFVTHGAHSALPDGLLEGGGFVRAENTGPQGIRRS